MSWDEKMVENMVDRKHRGLGIQGGEVTAQAKKPTEELLTAKERELDNLVNPRGALSCGAGWHEAHVSDLTLSIKALRLLCVLEEVGADNIEELAQDLIHSEPHSYRADEEVVVLLRKMASILTSQGET